MYVSKQISSIQEFEFKLLNSNVEIKKLKSSCSIQILKSTIRTQAVEFKFGNQTIDFKLVNSNFEIKNLNCLNSNIYLKTKQINSLLYIMFYYIIVC